MVIIKPLIIETKNADFKSTFFQKLIRTNT